MKWKYKYMIWDFLFFFYLQLASEIEMKNDLDVVQLLEKQYQERLEEEIAKVFLLFCYFKICLKMLSLLFVFPDNCRIVYSLLF